MGKRFTFDQETHLLFIDLFKAYDNVQLNHLAKLFILQILILQ